MSKKNNNNKRKKNQDEVEEEEEVQLDLESLKQEFKLMIAKINDENDKIEFTSFVCDYLNVNIDDSTTKNPASDESMQDNILATIIQDIKEEMPSIDTKSPTEKIIIPKNENFKGYTNENTINVDGFLYSEDDIDDLIERGKLKNNYCLDCKSHNTSPLNFISHSTTTNQLKYIFSQDVLGDLKGKTLLDIGSRLGSVLYTGYLFSNAKQLVGVEIDTFFYDLQQKMIEKYQMQDRVKLVKGDILKMGTELIESANVIFMNNVLEFFESDKEKHIAFWNDLKKLTNKNKSLRIVTIPAIEDTFKSNKLGISLKGWLKRVNIAPPEGIHEDDQEFEDYKEISLYKVI